MSFNTVLASRSCSNLPRFPILAFPSTHFLCWAIEIPCLSISASLSARCTASSDGKLRVEQGLEIAFSRDHRNF
jgi:hypothetical protein